jgi:hypothetical protein
MISDSVLLFHFSLRACQKAQRTPNLNDIKRTVQCNAHWFFQFIKTNTFYRGTFLAENNYLLIGKAIFLQRKKPVASKEGKSAFLVLIFSDVSSICAVEIENVLAYNNSFATWLIGRPHKSKWDE